MRYSLHLEPTAGGFIGALPALSALLAAVAAALPAPAVAGGFDALLRLVPPDAAAVVAVPRAAERLGLLVDSPAWAGFHATAPATRALDALGAEGLAGDLGHALGLTDATPRAVASLFVVDAVVCWLPGDPGRVEPLLLLDVDSEGLAALLDAGAGAGAARTAAALGGRLGGERLGEPLAGVEPRRLRALGARALEPPLVYAIADRILLVSPAERAVRAALQRLAASEGAAATPPPGEAPGDDAAIAAAATADANAGDRFDPAAVLALHPDLAAPEVVAWAVAFPWRLPREEGTHPGFPQVVASLRLEARGAAGARSLLLDVAADRARDLPPLPEGASLRAFEVLPGATVAAFAMRAGLRGALGVARSLWPRGADGGGLDAVLADLGRALGLPVEPDLADACGDEVALAVTRQRAAAGGQAAPAITLALAASDRARLDAALQRAIHEVLCPPLPAAADDEARADAPTYLRRDGLPGGATAHLIQPPEASGTRERMGGTVLPGYALVGDTLLVTTGGGILEAAAENAAGAGRSLARSPRFADTAALVPAGRAPIAQLHLDGTGVVDLLREHAAPLADFFVVPPPPEPEPEPPPPGGGPRAFERWREEVEAHRQRERAARARAAEDARGELDRFLAAAAAVDALRASLWAEPAPAPAPAPAPTAAPPGQRVRLRARLDLR